MGFQVAFNHAAGVDICLTDGRINLLSALGVVLYWEMYSELTKASTALPRLAVLSVLSAARRLVLIFANSLYFSRCINYE